jgi:hypothetical protein
MRRVAGPAIVRKLTEYANRYGYTAAGAVISSLMRIPMSKQQASSSQSKSVAIGSKRSLSDSEFESRPRKRVRLSGKMPRFGPYILRGAPKFRRPKKKPFRGVTPAMQKIETGGLKAANHCVYVGHTTHPLKATIRAVAMSVIHLYMRSIKTHVVLWTDKVGGNYANPNVKLELTYWYRTSPDNQTPIQGGVTSVNQMTWISFADALANNWMTNCTNATEHFSLQDIVFKSEASDATLINVFPYRKFIAQDIKIEVVGTSNMQIQNRTQGTSTDTDDVARNPLRGKQYSFKGSYPGMKSWGYNAAGDDMIANTETGVLAYADSTGTGPSTSTFVPEVEAQLKKPPPPTFFGRVKRSNYVKMQPGDVRKSYIRASVTRSLNQWMRTFFAFFSESNGNVSAGNTLMKHNVGEGVFFALEKLCDTGSEGADSVAIGYESCYSLAAMAKVRTKLNVAPILTPIGTAYT